MREGYSIGKHRFFGFIYIQKNILQWAISIVLYRYPGTGDDASPIVVGAILAVAEVGGFGNVIKYEVTDAWTMTPFRQYGLAKMLAQFAFQRSPAPLWIAFPSTATPVASRFWKSLGFHYEEVPDRNVSEAFMRYRPDIDRVEVKNDNIILAEDCKRTGILRGILTVSNPSIGEEPLAQKRVEGKRKKVSV